MGVQVLQEHTYLQRKGATRDIEYKRFEFEVKTIGEDGAFEGYASTFGNVDQGNDVVVKGAFKRSIDNKGGVVPILWQHDPDQPIGWNISAKEDEHGLLVKGQLLLNDALAQKAREFMALGLQVGAKVGLSIGYKVVQKEPKNGIRYLKELKLLEYSVVTFPMNIEAEVTGVKAEEENTMENNKTAAELEAEQKAGKKEPGHFATALQEVSDYSDGYHERQKRESALSSALWRIRRGDSTTDEKKKAMRVARHDHADSMSDLDDTDMDKAAAAKKDAGAEGVETKADSDTEMKAKADKKAIVMHKLAMAREYHKQGMKAHAAAMDCMKDMDLHDSEAGDGDGDEGKSATAEKASEAAVDSKQKTETSETTEQKNEASTTEDPDLLHSLRDGFKSLYEEGNDSKGILHSLKSGFGSLLA